MPKSVDKCVKLRTDAGVEKNLAHAICNKLNNEGKLGPDGRVKKRNSERVTSNMKSTVKKIDYKPRRDSNIHNVVNGQWMISPHMLDAIQGIFLRHVSNDKLERAEITKIIGGQLDNEDHGFLVTENGTAIIPIQGTVAKKMNMLHDISGGASSELIQKQISEALSSTDVKSIILDINSPGGTVEGAFELADFIFQNRNVKPIVSHSDGTMASAAFLFGAATNKIIVSSQLVQVGSIGVIAKHVDISKAEEAAGQKTTVLHSGKFKAVGHQHAALSLDDRMILQEKLDFMYSQFVTTVAKFRDVSVEKVLSDMADGRTFMGSNAIKAGLVDEISTLDNLILGMPDQINNSTDFNINNKKEVLDMEIKSVEDLKKNCPGLVQEIEEKASVTAIADFKKSDEFTSLQEKANADTDNEVNAQENAKLKAKLDKTETDLSELGRKIFAMQVTSNKIKSDKIFGEMVAGADYSENIQNKILSSKPNCEKHFNEEGNLDVDLYTEVCKKEVDSWAEALKGTDQSVDLGDGTDKEGEDAKPKATAYATADEGKW